MLKSIVKFGAVAVVSCTAAILGVSIEQSNNRVVKWHDPNKDEIANFFHRNRLQNGFFKDFMCCRRHDNATGDTRPSISNFYIDRLESNPLCFAATTFVESENLEMLYIGNPNDKFAGRFLRYSTFDNMLYLCYRMVDGHVSILNSIELSNK